MSLNIKRSRWNLVTSNPFEALDEELEDHVDDIGSIPDDNNPLALVVHKDSSSTHSNIDVNMLMCWFTLLTFSIRINPWLHPLITWFSTLSLRWRQVNVGPRKWMNGFGHRVGSKKKHGPKSRSVITLQEFLLTGDGGRVGHGERNRKLSTQYRNFI